MKNARTLTLTLALCSALSIRAYEFSFYNNTEKPVAIAIQYTGNDTNEPLYKQLVKPKSMVTFSPGEKGIPDIKWGFCLNHIYYVEDPMQEQKNNNFAKAAWRKITITWVKEKSTTKKSTPKKTPPAARKQINVKEKVKPSSAETSSFAKASKDKSKSKLATPAEKSLCKDRHFDIIHDEHQKIAITSSLAE